MPKSGLTMIEGLISNWLVNEGQKVEKGQPVFEFENEKTVIECESIASGFIHIVKDVQTVVKVGEITAYISETMDDYNSLISTNKNEESKEEDATHNSFCSNDCPDCSKGNLIAEANNTLSDMLSKTQRIKASGLAKAMAKNFGLDISKITGTGPNGRIIAKDVELYDKNSLSNTVKDFAAKENTEKYSDEVTVIPISGRRKAIAKNMHDSLTLMAQSTSITEFDVTNLIELKEKFASNKEFIGCKITMNDLFVMATVKMLKKHPLLNGTFDGEKIYSYSNVNIGVAVGAEIGLSVPVLKNADKFHLVQMSKALKELIEKAREGTLTSDETNGGTFTITNVGMFPLDFGTPIINPPQMGILGFGRPVKKYVEYKGEFCPRTMMHVMFTFDHRVLDGLEVGKIMQDLKMFIENPEISIA